LKVGIPRALLAYQYLPMWKVFLETLGAEVVVSPPTQRDMVREGIARMVTETCLPVKIYCGHVYYLRDKVDYIFIPAIRSVDKGAYNCGKFLGLPDLMRATVEGCPPLIEIDIDVNKGKRAFYEAIYGLGRHFTRNPLKIKEASERAWHAHQEYLASMRNRLLTPSQAYPLLSGNGQGSSKSVQARDSKAAAPDAALTVAVIGHPYNIYDTYINHNLLERLRSMDIRTLTYEMAPPEGIKTGMLDITDEHYWTYEGEVVGAAGYYFNRDDVDGVICVIAFGCGPDSVMGDMVQRSAKHRKKHYMSIIIDEHTGEAGLITRLEAFVDMIQRRRRHKERATRR